MALPQKRKGRWSSRSFFGLKTNHKKTILGKPSFGVGDATLDVRDPDVESPNALQTLRSSNASSNTVEKIHHRGSRLLSIVRLHGSANERGSAGKSLFKNSYEVTRETYNPQDAKRQPLARFP